MRIETSTRKLYQFAELDEETQQKAIEKLYDINVDHEWYDCTYEDVKEIGKIIGIRVDKVYFSGFSSQGDGACFEGSYEYAKGSGKAIRTYAPRDTELHGIADRLTAIQRPYMYGLYAHVKQRGHYYHENCTEIDVDHDGYYDTLPYDDIVEELRDFMRWIYSRLEKEYEYLTSEESIKETIEANEYEFDENGDLA